MIKYLPFAPGIPWKFKTGKYIIPKLKTHVWQNLLENSQDIIVIADGGLIESFMSLCYLEFINLNAPQKNIYWYGNDDFKFIIDFNGLAQKIELDAPTNFWKCYPAPIFLDKEKRIYFNCLNNYLEVKSLDGFDSYRDKKPLLQQAFRNITLSSWNENYKPKLRNLYTIEKEFINWYNLNRFNPKQPYICIFSKTKMSQHMVSCLNWNNFQIKALAAILKQQGIQTVCFTLESQKYYDAPIYCTDNKNFLFNLLSGSIAILSEEIDFLLIGSLISQAKLIALELKNEYDLAQNIKFIGSENVIYMNNELVPSEAASIIAGKI